MTEQRRILLVAPTVAIAQQAISFLMPAGYSILLMTDHANAIRELNRRPPDLLITQAKLGAFNGLQLAMHAQASSTPTIVVGAVDRHFQAEAEKYQAIYVSTPIADFLEQAVQRLSNMRSRDASQFAFPRQAFPTGSPRRPEQSVSVAESLLTH